MRNECAAVITGAAENRQYIVFPRYHQVVVTAYRLFPNPASGFVAKQS